MIINNAACQDQKLFRCNKCGRYLEESAFFVGSVSSTRKGLECKTCNYIKRHNGIPTLNGWDEKEILEYIDLIIRDKITCANDFLTVFQGKSLDDIIDLYKNIIIMNKPRKITLQCHYCNAVVCINLSAYFQYDHTYCSRNCYYKDKLNLVPKGEQSVYYKRICTECSNCGKQMFVVPFEYNTCNSEGENHNFCSQECYWEFRKKYYIGDRHPRLGKTLNADQRNHMRIATAKRAASSNRLNTKIQTSVDKILEANSIDFVREYRVEFYSIDNYLADKNLAIEVMGDYWHANPIVYNSFNKKINNIQYKTIIQDKAKKTHIVKKTHIPILYLWESDIKQNIRMCELLILYFVKNKGKIDDYHSYNYELDSNGCLCLNPIIVTPYFDQENKVYKNLLVS